MLFLSTAAQVLNSYWPTEDFVHYLIMMSLTVMNSISYKPLLRDQSKSVLEIKVDHS